MNTDDLLKIAKNACKKAGKAILKIYKWDFDIEIKDDGSEVTIADKLSNKVIEKILKQTNIPILSEEKKDNFDRLNSKYLWVIDPLDWTKDFIKKTWEFSIMIWLVKYWEPILWAVYLPTKNKLYFAKKWKWSFLEQNWRVVKLLVKKTNSDIILVSRNHLTDLEIKVINKIWFKSIPCGSIWVKLWLIAEWKAWNYLTSYNNFKEWDTCAPEIILKEAWWKITDKLWKKLEYNKKLNYHNGCIATNWVKHQIILDTLKKQWLN